MKNTLLGIFAIVAITYAYLNAPLSFRRHKDIEHGNTLISAVETYRSKHNTLPDTADSDTLLQLGFKHDKDLGWQPNYRKLDAAHYQIIYADGFEPPHLGWDSHSKTWQLIRP